MIPQTITDNTDDVYVVYEFNDRYSKQISIADLERMQNTNNYMPYDSMNDLSTHQAIDSSTYSYCAASSNIDSSNYMTHIAIAPANSSAVGYLNSTRRSVLIVVVALLASSITLVEGYTNRQDVCCAPKATLFDRTARYKLFSNSDSSSSSSSSSSSKLLGKDYLPAEALTRAAGGNMFEKVKLANDPVNVWTEVSDYAAAIRSGTIDW